MTNKNSQRVSHNAVFGNINVLEMCRTDGHRQYLGAVRKLPEKPKFQVMETQRRAALIITSVIG